MCKKTSYRDSVAILSIVGLMLSCGDPAQDSAENPIPSDPSDMFAQSSFDGCWDWYEDGEPVHNITITDGQIATLKSAGRTAQGTQDTDVNCTVSPYDGLVALSYGVPSAGGKVIEFTTFRFDLSDGRRVSMATSLAMGVVPGRKTVEISDPDDIMLLPPSDVREGQLVRCDEE